MYCYTILFIYIIYLCYYLYQTGDVDHKPYISAEPDVNVIPRVGTEEYIVLACDGLWDVITPDKTVELVYEHIQAGNSHNSKLAIQGVLGKLFVYLKNKLFVSNSLSTLIANYRMLFVP